MGESCSKMSCAIFTTDLRALHMALAGTLVPTGTVLVTPDLMYHNVVVRLCAAVLSSFLV